MKPQQKNVLIKTPLFTKDAREEMFYQYREVCRAYYKGILYHILILYFVSEHRRHNGMHNSQRETVTTFVKHI